MFGKCQPLSWKRVAEKLPGKAPETNNNNKIIHSVNLQSRYYTATRFYYHSIHFYRQLSFSSYLITTIDSNTFQISAFFDVSSTEQRERCVSARIAAAI